MESWIHVAPSRGAGTGTVEITVDANETNSTRTGTVSVETSTLNKELLIIQKGLKNMQFTGIHITFNVLGTINVYIEGVLVSNQDRAAPTILSLLRSTMTATTNACLFMVVHNTTNNRIFYCPPTYVNDLDYNSATLKLEDGMTVEISRTEGISVTGTTVGGVD